ncbi:hypothetical protein Poly24_14840 [Rosistilla carotiformis]|uniref:DUF58 domain-containing protein n=1 Tax=Rosistilla carotiformis TaxID=2528017 RepID=A0A518JQG2_9BACT|nr:hypothetical protein Poly24_14840 [Rosistilla carotiformis]
MRFTRSGYHFGFVALFTIVGAVVRDLNLLAILAGLLIGTLIIQWRFSRGTLYGLTVARQLPIEIFAGDLFPVRYRIHNLRQWLPAWYLQLDDRIVCESNRRETANGHAGLAYIGGQDEQLATFQCRIGQRGRYQLGPLKISTEFPFGLTRGSRLIDRREEFIVYPRLGRLRKGWRAWMLSDQPGLVVSRRRAGINEGDFYGLRGWQNGDSRRWIHWRTTARIGELAVRQFEQQQRQQIGLLVDLYQDTPSEESLERLIGFAATLMNEVLRNPETQVAFAISDGLVISNRNSRGLEFRRRVMNSLAMAARRPQPMLHDKLRELVGVSDTNWPLIIASTRPLNHPSLAAEDAAESVAGRLDLRWFNLADTSSEQIFMETPYED